MSFYKYYWLFVILQLKHNNNCISYQNIIRGIEVIFLKLIIIDIFLQLIQLVNNKKHFCCEEFRRSFFWLIFFLANADCEYHTQFAPSRQKCFYGRSKVLQFSRKTVGPEGVLNSCNYMIEIYNKKIKLHKMFS